MSEKQKKMLGRIVATLILFVVLLILEKTGKFDDVNKWILFVIYLVPYIIIGYDIVFKAFRNISHPTERRFRIGDRGQNISYGKN